MRRVIDALVPAIAAIVVAGLQPGLGSGLALALASQQPTKEVEAPKKDPNDPDAKKEPADREPIDKAQGHHPGVDADEPVGASPSDPDVPVPHGKPPKPPKPAGTPCCSGV